MHLLHHITKAQTDAMTTFIDKNPMVRSIASNQHFHLTLTVFSPPPRVRLPRESSRRTASKNVWPMTECLRTYDAFRLWRGVEDVLRRDVLRDFVKVSVTTALSVLCSPAAHTHCFETIFPSAHRDTHLISSTNTIPTHVNAPAPAARRSPPTFHGFCVTHQSF
jgi:hypothetical protein